MKKKISRHRKEIAEIKAGWQRCAADFENFKKRTEKERQNWLIARKMEAAYDLLPILDNFNHAAKHLSDTQKSEPAIIGFLHIHKQMRDLLSDWGIEEIDAKPGDKFDPNIHEAVESHNKSGGNIIASVHLPGYRIGDTILRPAKATVK